MLVAPLLSPANAAAESQILLEVAGELEDIGATTFDKKGRAIGRSHFSIANGSDGVKQMTVRLAVDGGGVNLSQATLAPIATESGPRMMRLVEQRSQATRADGISLDLLVIDHVEGRVSCYPAAKVITSRDRAGDPDDRDEATALDASNLSERNRPAGKHVELEGDDRIVNVPMQLFFQPLVERRVDELNFQIAACNDGPVLHSVIAVRGPTTRHEQREVVEIRYGPDFGKTVAWFASRLLPSFSFWFDTSDGDYLGHRMPLYRKGPEILLVRQGLAPPDLGVD